jgi:GDP-L-fucose synthase
MNILVLGANGFVGRNLTKHLSKTHSVTAIKRSDIDLLNSVDVRNFLEKNRFDVIINAAAVMTDNDALSDTRNNLGLFMNFYNNSDLFGKFINLASGAEFDRTLDIDSAEESSILERLPKDSYGFGQNIKSRLCLDKDNFYTLRIFNCFGAGEAATRIFSKFLSQLDKDPIEIHDRHFDYFSIQDLCLVVDNFVHNQHKVKDINCVYPDKLLISQVIDKFSKLNNLKPNYIVVSSGNNTYTGSGKALQCLNIPLNGLDKGLLEYVQNR